MTSASNKSAAARGALPVSMAQMQRVDMVRSGPQHAWRGLILQLNRGPLVPGLRIEVTPPWLLRIVRGGRTLLWAKLDSDHCGFRWRTGGFRESPLPPIPASLARSMGPGGNP